MTLLEKVKANLILNHSEDDALLETYLTAATNYAEGYQQVGTDFYEENPMSPSTEQGIIMLVTHFYESRDGSTAGFFNDTVNASDQVWKTVHILLRMGKEWQV